ncbi:hypothetical protein KVQ82_18665 [Pseudomonas sp. AO-1]|uniref:hypothetical protein n=1 Tax=Pseudomonas sp. AO-1 TaxID=2855434 RepID=UPI0011C3CEF6|nr:hypothetical protein [Pseudomonas sp. AO-1]QXZ12099.1 hypothetical protein KVQ82_18665 [Pseudomonas sp. AO-1]
MPTIMTCGHASRRTEFSYRGNARTGITLEFESGEVTISSAVINAITLNFHGQRVRGGFDMTNAPPHSVGSFLESNWPALTPRHASFLCAVLDHEGVARCHLVGNAVWVDFI